MADERTVADILEPFTSYEKRSHSGTGGDPNRLMELLSLVQQANKAKKELGKMVDNATKQMAVEIRALRRIQDKQLKDAGIID